MSKKNKIEKTGVLGGTVGGQDHPNYALARKIETPAVEKVVIDIPFQGKKEIILNREGTTAERLAVALVDKEMTQEQRDGAVAAYLFERGKESASFIAELFVFKGQYTKEGRKFKSQIRFDFSAFVDMFQVFLLDAAKGIREDIDRVEAYENIFLHLADRLESASDMLGKRMEQITKDRLNESGYGIFLDKNGQPFREEDVTTSHE